MSKKTLFLVIGMTFSFGSINAQSNYLSVWLGQTHSSFKYSDSKGEQDENLSSDIGYSFGVNYLLEHKSGVFLRPEVGFKRLGARSSINDKALDWSLHYLDANLGLGYILSKSKFKPFIGSSFYFSYLISADQRIGSARIDLLERGVIRGYDYGVNAHLGALYNFTYKTNLYFDFRYSYGLNQLEINSDPEQDQKLFNRVISINVGFGF